MIWRAEIRTKPGQPDIVGLQVKREIEDLSVAGIDSVSTAEVYHMEGEVSRKEMVRICEELLTDPVVQEYTLRDERSPVHTEDAFRVEVAYNPGVMDPVEASLRKGIEDLGIEGIKSVRTSRCYLILGAVREAEVRRISEDLLANAVIQHIVIGTERPAVVGTEYRFQLLRIPLREADEEDLMKISQEGLLSLNVEEMRAIRDYFRRLGRDPTDAELETLAQTWSEHCVHKTFRGLIEFDGSVIDNLLKSTIMKVTAELAKPWCISVFEDNAGIIAFDDRYALCFKVETHNHPSALEPYGGAGTGIGGVIRDPLGTGLGAKPILNTDVFCFGPPDLPYERLPKGCLHPKRVFKGVVAGVRDYGNRMGIPTINGSIFFDERYIGNPLVYCGNVGILPRDKCIKRMRPGDRIVLVGGRTGRDGIHGVTFASVELTEDSEEISSGAVQIGNPITEKKMVDVLIKARDLGLYSAITDCGGGGLSSAIGEMGEETGALVNLEKIPLKYEGLTYTEIWISEAQERMVLAVPPEHVQRLIELFEHENVEATVIGAFTGDRRLVLRYEGKVVCDLEMAFLHGGRPKFRRTAIWEKPHFEEPDFPDPPDLTTYLKRILSSPNVCSKEWVIRQYDHEVQGGSVLKPLQGVRNDGPGDASVVRPLLDSKRGVIVSNGINPKYGIIDPYWMAASAIDEALRQVISVGGSLERTALLDNFCWGNPDKPDRLGGLVRAAQACYDMARVYETPFISGKDSLNNEFTLEGESIPIPPTLLISTISVMEDVERTVSMDFKTSEDLIYVIGETGDEMGGSHYYFVRGYTGNSVPQVDPYTGKRTMDALSRSMAQGLVRACHDCSEGGIGVAIAEMAFAGEIGAEVHLRDAPRSDDVRRNDTMLFSESNSRFLVEVPREKQEAFERTMEGIAFASIGETRRAPVLTIYGLDGRQIVSSHILELKEAWQAPLRLD